MRFSLWVLVGVLVGVAGTGRAQESAQQGAVEAPVERAPEAPSAPSDSGSVEPPAPAAAPSVQTQAPESEPPGYPAPGYPQPFLRGPAISPADATKLRVLEADLNVLAQLSSGRVLDSTLSIVAGAAFFTIGVFIDDTLVSTLLEVTGGLSAARGIVGLVALPDGESPAREYTHLPMVTGDQVQRRIAFGEEALLNLARETRRARLLDGSLTMLAGATYVPLYLLLRQNDEPGYQFADDAADWVAVGVGTVSFAAGLISVLRKSEAEQRARAYAKLKSELDARSSSSSLWPSLRLRVDSNGLMVSARARF